VRIEQVASKDLGSKLAAKLFVELSEANPNKPVGLATGSTMTGIYQELQNLRYTPTLEVAFALD
jgi:6-phosphogluconolactonase/glucosamine-6-phosphate isomerase/deaminase